VQGVYYIEYGTYWKAEKKSSAAEPNVFARIGVIIIPQARSSYQIESEKHICIDRAFSEESEEAEKEDVWAMSQDGILTFVFDDSNDSDWKDNQGVLQKDKQNTPEKLLNKKTSIFEQERHIDSDQGIRWNGNPREINGIAFALRFAGKGDMLKK
jgi:hypothetical protein